MYEEAELATPQESVFWKLVTLALGKYSYFPSKLNWDGQSQTYELHVTQLGVPESERVVTVFNDQFLASVANGCLHESIRRNLLDAVIA